MTTAEFDRLSAGASIEQAQGWTASVLLHLAAATCGFLLMMEVDRPVLQETFRWNVSMVESPIPSESQLVVPVVQPPPPPIRPNPNPPIQRKRQLQSQTHHETTVPLETTQFVKDIVTHAEPVMAYAGEQPTDSQQVTTQAVVEEAVETTERPIVEQALPLESISRQVEHRTVEFRQVHYRKTRADFGWLSATVQRRIEELKGYPVQARMNHWEGKVVVSAVIRDDGEVIGVRIQETSGRAVLDEEAMAVMKRASPLTLKYPFGQRQITILVPISYRLDG